MSLSGKIKHVEDVIGDLLVIGGYMRIIEDLIDSCKKSSESEIETNISSLENIYSTLRKHFFISDYIELSKESDEFFELYNNFADYIDEMVDHENGNRKEGHIFLDKLSLKISFVEDFRKIIHSAETKEADDVMYGDFEDLLEMMKEEISIKKVKLREREAGRSLDDVFVGPNGVTPVDWVALNEVWNEEMYTFRRPKNIEDNPLMNSLSPRKDFGKKRIKITSSLQ